MVGYKLEWYRTGAGFYGIRNDQTGVANQGNGIVYDRIGRRKRMIQNTICIDQCGRTEESISS